MSLEVRRSGDRFRTDSPGISTWHSFSFGPHYDPANTAHGSLVANNEHLLASGAGFEDHHHRDLEIVTWVLSGSVEHQDNQGNTGTINAGEAQVLSAGSGVVHRELNAAETATRFVQMWVVPDERGLAPSYRSARVEVRMGVLDLVASADPQAPLTVHRRSGSLYATRLITGTAVALPGAVRAHVFVIEGVLSLGAPALQRGDAARLTDEGELILTGEGEALVWIEGR